MSFTPKPTILKQQKNSNESNLSTSLNKRRIDAEIAAKKLKEKNVLERQQLALRRQKEFSEKTHIWNEQILPKWNEVCQSPKVRELCSKGIPPNIRGKVWPLLIGNDLDIDEKMFEELNRKVLMIYGNKVVTKMQGSRDSADGGEIVEEHPEDYNPTATYGLYRDSFDSDDGKGAFEIEPSSRANSNIRAPSADIPIPMQIKALSAAKTHLDVTEEEWFQNERNGSLDSETFELIQKQLFKRTSNEDDQASSLEAGPGNERYTLEDYYGVHQQQGTEAGNADKGIAMPSTLATKESSVDSHFTIESYNMIGSYVDHIKHTSHAIPIKNKDGQYIASGLDHYHYSKTADENEENPISASSYPVSEDLNEFSFNLVTGGDSREIFNMSASPSGVSGTSPLPPTGLALSTSRTETPPIRKNISRSVQSTSQRSFSESPHTPPPRRRHSEEYLTKVGLLPDEEGIQRTFSDEAIVEKSEASSYQLDGLNLSVLNPDNGSSDKLYCNSANVTPLKTKQPFNVINSNSNSNNDMNNDFNSTIVPSTELPIQTEDLESSQPNRTLSMEDNGSGEGSGARRRKSASMLTNLLLLTEEQEAAAKEEQARLEAEAIAAREAEDRAEREKLANEQYKRKLSEERKRTLSPQSASNAKLINTMSLIEWDLPRTFPTLGFFHDGGPMHTGLERILLCYACFRPDIGYVQGMSFLVATLLLYMDEFEAFKCLANLLGRRVNMDFYRLKKEAIDSYVMCFDHFFKKSLPLLYNHMCDEGVTSEMYLMDWNMALFTKALPLEVAAQVWDMYLFEGEMYIMCVGLGILKMYAPKLSTLGVEKISPFLLHLPEKINPEELFANVAQIQINKKSYDKVRKKMTDQARANAEQLGIQKSRSAGNLQDLDDEVNKPSRLVSLKKAIRATRDNIIGTRNHSAAPSEEEVVNNQEVNHNNHTHQSPPRSSIATQSTATNSSVGGSVPSQSAPPSSAKKGMECIPS